MVSCLFLACQVNADIVFALDESGSVLEPNFDNVRQFVIDFISTLEIGPNDNQIGAISFDDDSTIEFGLDDHDNLGDLMTYINGIPYNGGLTNIRDALCDLYLMFTNPIYGARLLDTSVLRVGIVITDGEPNSPGNSCNFGSVVEGGNTLRAAVPPIIVFALGVGNSISFNTLEDIATVPEFVFNASSFDPAQLECVRVMQEEAICFSCKFQVANIYIAKAQENDVA